MSTLLSLIVATFNSEWVTAELIVSGLLNVVKYEFIIEISKVLWKTRGLDEKLLTFKMFPFLMHYVKVGNFEINWSINPLPSHWTLQLS